MANGKNFLGDLLSTQPGGLFSGSNVLAAGTTLLGMLAAEEGRDQRLESIEAQGDINLNVQREGDTAALARLVEQLKVKAALDQLAQENAFERNRQNNLQQAFSNIIQQAVQSGDNQGNALQSIGVLGQNAILR